MRVIIAGSRTINSMAELEKAIVSSGWNITDVIDGAHWQGVDVLSKRWTIDHSVPHYPVPAQWQRFGRAAGPIRNRYMAECKQADGCIIVWDGTSTGSMSMKEEADKMGIPVYLHIISNAPVKVESSDQVQS
jgi:hypothetical protein